MSDKFDDFFNEFFGFNNEENNKDKEPTDEEKIESVEKFMNMINEFNSENSIEDNFGEPDEIEYFEEDEVHYQRKTWNTAGGKIIKTVIIDTPETPEDFHKFEYRRMTDGHLGLPMHYEENLFEHGLRDSLQNELDMAIESEEYEEAARLRDLIKSIDDDK